MQLFDKKLMKEEEARKVQAGFQLIFILIQPYY